jgi:hypothetical protein
VILKCSLLGRSRDILQKLAVGNEGKWIPRLGADLLNDARTLLKDIEEFESEMRNE